MLHNIKYENMFSYVVYSFNEFVPTWTTFKQELMNLITIVSVIFKFLFKLILPELNINLLQILFILSLSAFIIIQNTIYYFLFHYVILPVLNHVTFLLEIPLVWVGCVLLYLLYKGINCDSQAREQIYNMLDTQPNVIHIDDIHNFDINQFLRNENNSDDIPNPDIFQSLRNRIILDGERISAPVFRNPVLTIHEDSTCSICISDVHEDMLELSNCMLCHKTFHTECLVNIRDGKCPNCRQQTIFHDVQRIRIITETKEKEKENITHSSPVNEEEKENICLNEEKGLSFDSLKDNETQQVEIPNESI